MCCTCLIWEIFRTNVFFDSKQLNAVGLKHTTDYAACGEPFADMTVGLGFSPNAGG